LQLAFNTLSHAFAEDSGSYQIEKHMCHLCSKSKALKCHLQIHNTKELLATSDKDRKGECTHKTWAQSEQGATGCKLWDGDRDVMSGEGIKNMGMVGRMTWGLGS
jgi:hypothetical protein